ncbi:MAG: alpha/beta fold hydrolase, partial [Polyangiaceae bacterium]
RSLGAGQTALFLLLLALAGCKSQGGTGATPSPTESSLATPSAPTRGVAGPGIPPTEVYEVSGLAPGERRPLLVVLHGLGGSGHSMFEALRLAEFGARERVFVVAPDGTLDQRGRRFWNAGDACCNFEHRAVDDVARLRNLIDLWRARPDIDPKRVYVMGHSNGGFMTERMACELGERISGAVSLAGAAPPMDLPCPRSGSLQLLAVHGDADVIVRYEGGTVFDSPLPAAFPSATQGFKDWAKRQGCTGTPLHLPDVDVEEWLPGAETTALQYRNCTSGSVTLWTVRSGDHSVGTDPHALAVIWGFLSAPL